MAKNIFINNLDTYVSKAIFQELRNDMPDEEGNKPDDANVIFGTYITKDSSIKPDGVKKMLKVGKAVTNFVEIETQTGTSLPQKLRLDCLRLALRQPHGRAAGP